MDMEGMSGALFRANSRALQHFALDCATSNRQIGRCHAAPQPCRSLARVQRNDASAFMED
eukprot:5900233-Amphidinium_carterae.1